MAEAILLSALLPLVFEKTADLIGKQLGKILGADVERELGKLQSTLTTIRAVLQDAEQKQVTDVALRLWLSNLKLAAYDADDLLDDFNLHVLRRRPETRARKLWRKVRDFFTSHNPLLFRTSMSSRIKDVVERIDSLAADRTRFCLTPDGGDSVERLLASRPHTHSYVPESGVVGRKEDVSKIAGMVIAQEHEKNVSVLPILGMGGLGKTTLAQMVYNEPTVKEHFELRMWLSVTHDFSAAKIAKAMIETATESGFSLSDMDSLQRSLRQVIGAKRYLLVLDDVWNEDPEKWEELKVLLTFGAQGSAVIITTRSGIASALMGTLDIYRLAELSEDDCWILFEQRAFVGRAEERPNLVAIGRAIVNKCGGLPLAAKALGSVMRLKRDEREWKSVMESEIWNLPEGKSGILPALRLSYYHLPSHLKQCFAFCAIFPRSHEIEKEMLIKLWMANGFIPCKAEMELEFEGNRIFEELEQRSFFQDVKEVKRWYDDNSITTCRMHDLIHDLARSIMGNECCILDQLKLDDISKTKYRHLLINYEGKSARVSRAASFSKGKRTRSQTLRTLLLRNNQHGPPKSAGNPPISWSDTKYLRALSLHNIGMTEFPISICNLRHLRYLDLSHNDVQTLPEAISNIFSLQTLNLSACGLLLRLPESLKHMSSLMHLYLEGCRSLTCMPKGMGQLRYLQTLTRYTAGSGDGSGSIAELRDLNLQGMLELNNLKNVENVADAEEANLGSKENLRQINFDWGESNVVELRARIAEEVLQALRPHQNLKQLTICHYQGIKFPTWLSKDSMLLSNLVEIVLADCSRCEHLPELWQLPSLEILEIANMKSLKHMGGCEFYGSAEVVEDGTAFPSLRKLRLYGMCNLEEWSGAEGLLFPHIVEIEIVDCPKLMTMPALPSAQVLQIRNCPLLRPANGFFRWMKSLEKLNIDSCDKMTLLLEQEDETEVSLRYLEIKNCEQLMFLSPSLGLWKYFNSLHNLEIKSCNGLVMFPIDVMHGLISLRRLVIHCCYNLMGTSEEEEGLQFQGLPSLEELDIQVCVSFPCFHPEGLRQFTVLKKLLIYSNHGLTTLPQFPECVRDVTIYNCWNLVTLPEELGLLPALERFVIISLHEVSSLPEEMQGYKALKSLKIEDCPRVISLPVGIQQRLPSLKYLDIKGCPELEKRCMAEGEYWPLVSRIPVKYIGGS